jgi:hypothetical protein
LLQNEVADADALQDESSPQFLALRGLANEDNTLLDLDSTPTVIIVERYVLAVFYFATIAEGGSNSLNVLSGSSVCGLNEVSCNGDGLVVGLNLRKSKHGEVIVLISKDRTWIGFSISYECHACSHFLAILLEQLVINSRAPFRLNLEH